MPPKAKHEDLIEAILDPRVVSALAAALSPLITTSIDAAIDKKIGELLTAVRDLKRENNDLRKKQVEDGQKINVLVKLVDEQAIRLDNLENYSRSDNLVIRGLPEATFAERATASTDTSHDHPMAVSHQSVESTLIDFCQNSLGVKLSSSDISVAHRIRSGPKDKVRPIIVRFTNRRSRDAVYRSRKLLGPDQKIYISEQLTKNASNLFYEARQLRTQKRLSSAWTKGGQVFVKFTSDPAVRPTLVKTKLDLTPRM